MNQEMKPMSGGPSRLHPKDERNRQYLIRAAGVAWVILCATYIGLFIHWVTCPL